MAISNCSHCLALAERKGRRSMPKTWLPMSSASRRERKRHGNGEPPGEIDQLRIVGDLRGDAHWLERHAADRAVARPFLHDLRMHRAGVERALRQRLRLALLGQIALWVGCELGTAALGAEPDRSRRDVRSSARARRYRPSSRIRGRWPCARRFRSSRLCRGASRMGSS